MARLSALRTRASSKGARAVLAKRKMVAPVSGNQ
jgi:hypothetical protein